MKKWYRKTVVKAALLAVAIISGAMMTTNLLGALTLAGTANPVEVWKLSGQPFEESEDFNSMVQGMMAEVLERIRLEKMFETDGAYNSDKLVDVMEYSKKGSISGENSSGVAYTLEELESWSEDYSSGEGTIYDDNSVIVCERADGSYYYYYLSDFLALLNNRQMVLVMDGADPDQFLEGLENGEYTTSGQYDFRILDSEGEILYTDCWNFGESLREKFAPDGAENLLQIVNGNPQLNGKLSIIYDNLAAVLSSIYSDIQTYQSGWAYLSEGNTNFTYLYINEDTKRVQTNRGEYQDYEKAADNIAEMKEKDSVKYMVVYPKLSDFETNMSISVSNEWDSVRTYENRRNFNSIFAVSVDTDFPIQDQFYEGKQNYDQNAPFLKNSLILASAGGIFFLIAAIWLTMAAGRNEKDNALRLTSFDRWKTEIAVLVVLAVWGLGTVFFLAAENGIGSFSQFTNTAAAYYNEAAAYEGTAVYYSGMFTNMLSLFDITALFLYGLFTFFVPVRAFYIRLLFLRLSQPGQADQREAAVGGQCLPDGARFRSDRVQRAFGDGESGDRDRDICRHTVAGACVRRKLRVRPAHAGGGYRCDLCGAEQRGGKGEAQEGDRGDRIGKYELQSPAGRHEGFEPEAGRAAQRYRRRPEQGGRGSYEK